jgi:teichuronic acid biosynthesis glycosyltransferase TuaG
MIATSSVIIDRNIVKNFKMPLIRSGQDYAAWLHILKNGIAACGIDEALVQYRVLKNSLSSNKFKSIKQVYITQTQMQNIPKHKAAFNTFCFSINAVKKYFF